MGFGAIILLSHILLVQGVLATDPDDGVFIPDYQDINESANDYADAELYDSYLYANSPGFPKYVDNEFPKASYTDWDQGNCGNCWVWSSTAAVAQSYKLYSGNDVPLSIQFFNSNYFDGNIGQVMPHDWACTGGYPSQFAESYTAGLNQSYSGEPFVVPLSNPNASYVDGSISPSDAENLTTLRPKEEITTSPNIRFSSMTAKRLVTAQDLTDQTAVINNLTEVLAEGREIVYILYWTDWTTLSHFRTFWNYDSENSSSLYDPSYMDGIEYTGGPSHVMVIVGYNKTDPDQNNWYWIVQNSWSTSSYRPHGQFRLKMNMDYNASYYLFNGTGIEWYPLQQLWTVDVDWTQDQAQSSDSGDGSGRDSYVATATPVSSGQSMSFAINEPVTSGDPVGIVSVDVVPNTALGSTDLTVADTDTSGDSAFAGREVADIESINLVAVNPSSVSSGTITFAVSGSWMQNHGVETS
ncbi:MAG: C1 family peptidase, partial [Methanoregula sp.]